MTILEEDIVAVLTGITVYPDTVPSDAIYPCATYQMISDKQFRSHAGNELRRPRIQITVWGKDKLSTLTTGNTIKGLMDLNRTDVVLATKEDEGQGKEAESGLYYMRLDFFIWTNK